MYRARLTSGAALAIMVFAGSGGGPVGKRGG